jgi:hypothetical protein
MMRKILFGFAFVFLAFAMFGYVSAAGVSTQIWEENHLKAYPGQEGVIPIHLQNMVGGEDLVFYVEYEDNPGGITSVDETEYEVPFGRSDILVELKYKIPEDAQIGETYNVRLLFRTTNPNWEGGIRTAPAFGRVFPIDIATKEEVQPSPVEPIEEKADYTFIWYLVGVLIVAGIIVYFVMRKKK